MGAEHVTGPTKQTRQRVLKRDDGKCVRCGAIVADPDTGVPFLQYSLQHRRPRGMGGSKDPVTNSLENLIVLCGSAVTGCHGAVEVNRESGRRFGYAVPQWRDPAVVLVQHWQLGWAWPTPDGVWIPALSGWDTDGQPHWITPTYAKDLAIARGIPVDPMDPRFVRLCTDLTDAVLGIRGVTA